MLTTDSLGNVRAIEKVAMFESSVVLYGFFGRLGRQWVLSNDDRNGNENGKKAIRLDQQNKSFARASRFFGTFLCRRCTTTT